MGLKSNLKVNTYNNEISHNIWRSLNVESRQQDRTSPIVHRKAAKGRKTYSYDTLYKRIFAIVRELVALINKDEKKGHKKHESNKVVKETNIDAERFIAPGSRWMVTKVAPLRCRLLPFPTVSSTRKITAVFVNNVEVPWSSPFPLFIQEKTTKHDICRIRSDKNCIWHTWKTIYVPSNETEFLFHSNDNRYIYTYPYIYISIHTHIYSASILCS